MNRLIYVTGTPSGGTSCVAGVLAALGVNMGSWQEAPGIRGYTTYEDRRMDVFKVTPKGTPEDSRILRQRFRFADYIRDRQEKAAAGERIGFKGSALYWMGVEDFASLPVDIVIVDRPLEDALASDSRVLHDIATRREGTDTSDERMTWRAAGVAGAWRAKEMLVARFPELVKFRASFYEMLDSPSVIGKMSTALDLHPTLEQFKKAAAVADGGKLHIRGNAK